MILLSAIFKHRDVVHIRFQDRWSRYFLALMYADESGSDVSIIHINGDDAYCIVVLGKYPKYVCSIVSTSGRKVIFHLSLA